MKILRLTHSSLPHVGGIVRSAGAFARVYRRVGHDVLIVTPMLPDMLYDEDRVVCVPDIQKFNESDFSVRIPLLGYIKIAPRNFNPDLVHSHTPFFMGDTSRRFTITVCVPRRR